MIFLLFFVLGFFSAAPLVAPLGHIHEIEADTTWIVVPQGDTASIELQDRSLRMDSRCEGIRKQGNQLWIDSDHPGRRDVQLRSFVGRRTQVARLDIVPRTDLPLVLRALGVRPTRWADSATLSELGRELARLFAGTGIHPRIFAADAMRLPPSPSFWDPEGDGYLDLVRNDDSLHPAPALDSLVTWIAQRNLRFPQMIVLQTPIRVGWALESRTEPGDSLLRLANQTTLPWRDGRGASIRYVLQAPSGARADTFEVVGYDGNTMRVRTRAPTGTWTTPHLPGKAIVLRPDHQDPAFGLSPSWRPKAAPFIMLPDARKLENPRRAARVIAHEIGHSLGLQDLADGSNLMSAVLRMDMANPTLTPAQVLRLHEGLRLLPK